MYRIFCVFIFLPVLVVFGKPVRPANTRHMKAYSRLRGDAKMYAMLTLCNEILTPAHPPPPPHNRFCMSFSCLDFQMQEWMKDAPEWAQGYSERLFGAMVEDHRARSFVLAWATCKVIEPLRLIGAIAITPRLARSLGRAPAKIADDGNDDVDANDRKAP